MFWSQPAHFQLHRVIQKLDLSRSLFAIEDMAAVVVGMNIHSTFSYESELRRWCWLGLREMVRDGCTLSSLGSRF